LGLLKTNKIRFGNDEKKVIELSNKVTFMLSKILKKYRNIYGGTLKFGLSAPSYISDSVGFEASLDGRRNGEPFQVHISSDVAVAYTEIVNFASKIEYSDQRFNANVVDFIVTPSFIDKNFDKFVDFLIFSIEMGFFQLQMNVVSSEILIRAKENPQEFPNLIVRVWGFSSYFNDLPEEYKNLLIKRALESERGNGNSN
jgi:formate C-acetyltransferase